MAWAMRYACDAGRLAYLAGRIPKKLYANAQQPDGGADRGELIGLEGVFTLRVRTRLNAGTVEPLPGARTCPHAERELL